MSIGAAINHLGVEIDDRREAEDLAYTLGAAPLGEINPAMEAAVATARYLAGLTNKAEYIRRLRRQIEASSSESVI